jgi:hypothetical protein
MSRQEIEGLSLGTIACALDALQRVQCRELAKYINGDEYPSFSMVQSLFACIEHTEEQLARLRELRESKKY